LYIILLQIKKFIKLNIIYNIFLNNKNGSLDHKRDYKKNSIKYNYKNYKEQYKIKIIKNRL